MVMTLDGVLTLKTAGGEKRKVLDCKPANRLEDTRTKQKMAIHEEFARRQGWEYSKFTDKCSSQEVIHNIQWMQMSATRSGEQAPAGFDIHKTALLTALMKPSRVTRSGTVIDFLQHFETSNGMQVGTALRCLKQLLWDREVDFDLSSSFARMLRGPTTALTKGPGRLSC
jgi:hypothetical protein